MVRWISILFLKLCTNGDPSDHTKPTQLEKSNGDPSDHTKPTQLEKSNGDSSDLLITQVV
jgi:hypothetical protein